MKVSGACLGIVLVGLGVYAGCSPAGAVRPTESDLPEIVEADVVEMSAADELEWHSEESWGGGDLYASLELVSLPQKYPGAPGAACDEDRDCVVDLCMDVGSGRICSGWCVEECGPGLHCAAPSSEVEMYCLPEFLPQCRPCMVTADCERFRGDDALVCTLSEELGGQFCLAKCGQGQECPSGSRCDDSGLCQPEASACECGDAATNLGAVGMCLVESQAGRCTGERECTSEGLSACSAAVPRWEVCDGHDDDCDGQVDEGIAPEECFNKSDYGTCPGKTQCQDAVVVCQGQKPGPEACNGMDDNCDGQVDEPGALGCAIYYLDADGDGYGGTQEQCFCAGQEGWVSNRQDCDDTHSGVNPVQVEICDGVDTDCDGQVDDGCDEDGDGYCGKVAVVWGEGYVCGHPELDCLDINPGVHPGAEEWCNALDDDCDTAVDEECDQDGDGYCSKAVSVWGAGYVCKKAELDCDDLEAEIHPGSPDVCDGRDNNCNGSSDELCDQDGDGWCVGSMPVFHVLCLLTGGGLAPHCEAALAVCPNGYGDCRPSVGWANPGASEACNGLDDDCDGVADNGIDGDEDGFCAQGVVKEAGCAVCFGGAPDCDDTRPDVYVGALDWPDLDGRDANCDGVDGVLEETIFVDGASGNDLWPGTMAQPKASLKAALAEADKSPARKNVLVAVGTYPGPIEVPEGVRLWGGFLPAMGWGLADTEATVIEGDTLGVKVTGAVATTVVGRLRIQTVDAWLAGGSSQGVVAVDSPGLALEGLEIWVGAGAPGEKGQDGLGGLDGQAGSDGMNGCLKGPWGLCYHPWSDNTCAAAVPGGGSPNSNRCGGSGHGLEALPTVGVWDSQILAQWDPAVQAEPSCCFKRWGEAKGGLPGLYSNTDATPGGAGGNGTAGAAGYHGKGAEGVGLLGSSGWRGSKGSNGGDGGYGCGGGGGAQGDNKGGTICDYKGGGGGGGGEGGTGGMSGLGGGPGGGSVGIALVTSAGNDRRCQVHTAGGGKGGQGGSPGKGGSGGSGGAGGPGLEGSGHGGDGGDGGFGGQGGVGGGGLGGASCGLVYSQGDAPLVEELGADLGPAGLGGFAGSIGADIPGGQVGLQPGAANKGKLGPKAWLLIVP